MWKDGRKYEGEYRDDKKSVTHHHYCRDSEFILGLMVENMRVIGWTVSKMVTENIYKKMENSESVYGIMENGFNGCKFEIFSKIL